MRRMREIASGRKLEKKGTMDGSGLRLDRRKEKTTAEKGSVYARNCHSHVRRS